MSARKFRLRYAGEGVAVLAIVCAVVSLPVFATGETELADEQLYEQFPSRPVNVIVPYPAGGGTDVIFRAVASVIEPYWGQPLVVTNRPGAGGTVGASFAAQSDPDGYTLLATLQGAVILNPLQMEVDYSSADFDYVAQLVANPMPFVGQAGSPFENVAELIEFAEANPGELTIGTTGLGTLPHLMTLYLQELAGIDYVVLPLAGNAPLLRETLAGNIDGYITTVKSAILDGSVKGLGLLAEERSPDIPDVPTFAELGYPDMVADVWFGVAVPTGTPEPIQRKIEDTLRQVVLDSEFIATMRNVGNNTAFLDRSAFSDKIDDLASFFPTFLRDIGLLE